MVVALVIGCPTPGSGIYQPPAGKGAVLLNINKTIERAATILPEDVDVTTFFGTFELDFQPRGTINPGTAFSEYYSYSDLSDPIDLDRGDYTLIVTAYKDVGDSITPPTQPAAIGELELTIVADTPSAETITLGVINPAAGQIGTFAWSITNSVTALSAATMSVTPVAGGEAILTVDFDDTYNLTDPTWAGSQNIASGYYYVNFSLTATAATAPFSRTRNFQHVLHVYQNMTSSFTYTFDNAKFTIETVVIEQGTFEPTVVFEAPEDLKPILSADGGTTTLADMAVVDINLGNTRTITVTNAADVYRDDDDDPVPYGTIAWSYNGTVIPTATGPTLLVNTTAAPYNAAGRYQLTVTGTIAGKPYFAEIYINVLALP
jgi:hypothetical protein